MVRAIRQMTLGIGVAAAFVLGACQTTDPASDRLTWERGWLAIPGAAGGCHKTAMANKDCLAAGPKGAKGAEGKVPAVLFLHGCAGINSRQHHVWDLFIEAGYVTFMPDSFARPNRRRACGSSYTVIHLRYAEIKTALAEIAKIPWIDQKRLVLAGFSSGAIAASDYSGDEFMARVVLGWGCRRGIAAAGHIPVLNLVGAGDNETRRGNELCSVGGRPKSAAVHVDAGHDVADDAAAAGLVKAFLDKVL